MEKDYQNEAVSDMIERHEGIIMKEQINDYLHYLNIERGLSANTRQSYERDLNSTCIFYRSRKLLHGRMSIAFSHPFSGEVA